jgi:glycerol transport system substrate-binding protein
MPGRRADPVLERIQKSGVQGDCGPKLNPKQTADYWFARPKGRHHRAQRKLMNAKPKGETIDYDTLIKSWPATAQALTEASPPLRDSRRGGSASGRER